MAEKIPTKNHRSPFLNSPRTPPPACQEREVIDLCTPSPPPETPAPKSTPPPPKSTPPPPKFALSSPRTPFLPRTPVRVASGPSPALPDSESSPTRGGSAFTMEQRTYISLLTLKGHNVNQILVRYNAEFPENTKAPWQIKYARARAINNKFKESPAELNEEEKIDKKMARMYRMAAARERMRAKKQAIEDSIAGKLDYREYVAAIEKEANEREKDWDSTPGSGSALADSPLAYKSQRIVSMPQKLVNMPERQSPTPQNVPKKELSAHENSQEAMLWKFDKEEVEEDGEYIKREKGLEVKCLDE